MKTFNKFYKIIILAMVFGLLGVPAAMAHKDRAENPLYNIALPSGTSNAQYLVNRDVAPVTVPNAGNEITATAALSEEGNPTMIKDFSMDFEGPVGPLWNSIPGKDD